MNYKKSIISSIFAFVLATSCCWLPALIIAIGGGSALIGLSDGLNNLSGLFLFIGLGLLVYGVYQFRIKKRKKSVDEVILQSTITCPNCNHSKVEMMPTNACQYFYECTNCKSILKPLGNDCCVYCSYGTIKCPPIQLDQNCC